MPKAIPKTPQRNLKKAAPKKAAKAPAKKAAPVKTVAAKKPTAKHAVPSAKKSVVKAKAEAAPVRKAPVALLKLSSTTPASEPVGMWKLLADKKAQAKTRRESENERAKMNEDDRNRFAKHETRYAKFAGPRRRAS